MKMYKQILIMSLVALFTFNVFGAVSDVSGQWQIQDRFCSDGQKAQDAFELNRDSIDLNIIGESGTVVVTIDGRQTTYEISLNYVSGQILWEDSFSLFDLKNDKLIIYSGGFGIGGTCLPGSDLTTVFSHR